MYPLAFSSIDCVDDYGNIYTLRTASQVDRFLISTNTYGGYDHNHADMQDAII